MTMTQLDMFKPDPIRHHYVYTFQPAGSFESWHRPFFYAHLVEHETAASVFVEYQPPMAHHARTIRIKRHELDEHGSTLLRQGRDRVRVYSEEGARALWRECLDHLARTGSRMPPEPDFDAFVDDSGNQIEYGRQFHPREAWRHQIIGAPDIYAIELAR